LEDARAESEAMGHRVQETRARHGLLSRRAGFVGQQLDTSSALARVRAEPAQLEAERLVVAGPGVTTVVLNRAAPQG
jgi:hypothetical protein